MALPRTFSLACDLHASMFGSGGSDQRTGHGRTRSRCDLGAISVRSRRRHLLLKHRHLAVTAEIVRRSVAVPTAHRHKPAHTPLPTQPARLSAINRPCGTARLSRWSNAFSETRSITRRWLSVSAGDVTSSRNGMTPSLFGVSTPRRAPSSPHACAFARHQQTPHTRRSAARDEVRMRSGALRRDRPTATRTFRYARSTSFESALFFAR